MNVMRAVSERSCKLSSSDVTELGPCPCPPTTTSHRDSPARLLAIEVNLGISQFHSKYGSPFTAQYFHLALSLVHLAASVAS